MKDSRTAASKPNMLDDLIGATYARISTAKQKDGISLDDQDDRMLVYTVSNNIVVPDDYRFKEQESGFKEERTEYDKIRQLVRDRRINVLVVYGSDRHTRDPIHGEIFRAELRRNEVALHIITEGGEVDIISPTGQFFRRQMDNFNWYWGKMIQQVTQDKKQAYTRQGVPYQQGTVRYGYKRVGKQGNATIESVPEEAKIVDEITLWFDEGVGVADIQRRLEGIPTPGDTRGLHFKKRPFGTWGDIVVYDILKDEIYAGTYYANKWKIVETETGRKKRVLRPKEEWTPIAVPAIIPRERWERNQARLAAGRRNGIRPHAKNPYLLAKRSVCRLCQSRIQCSTPKTMYSEIGYYSCNARNANLAKGKCVLPYFQSRVVDAKVWELTRKLLEDRRALRATLEQTQAELHTQQEGLYRQVAELDELIKERKEEVEALVRGFRKARGSLLVEVIQRQADELAQIIEGLLGQRARLEARLKPNIITNEEIVALEKFADKVRPRLPHATFKDKRDIIEALKFTFEFTVEDGQKVVYVLWHTHEFRLSLADENDQEDSSSLTKTAR